MKEDIYGREREMGGRHGAVDGGCDTGRLQGDVRV